MIVRRLCADFGSATPSSWFDSPWRLVPWHLPCLLPALPMPQHAPAILQATRAQKLVLRWNLQCCCMSFSGGRATFRARSSQHSGHPGTPHSGARSCADTQQRPFGSYGWHRRQCRHGAVIATPQAKVETRPARSFGGSLVSRFRGVAADLL